MKRSAVFILAAILAVLTMLIQASYAQKSGPYAMWVFAYAVTTDYYPEGTVKYCIELVNTHPVGNQEIIDRVTLITPWKTYNDTTLPMTINHGEGYFWIFEIIIPASQQPGSTIFEVQLQARYWDGSNWASLNVPPMLGSVKIMPNPYTLQEEVADLQQTINTLQQNITSLEAEISTLEKDISSFEKDIADKEAELNNLKTQLSSLQKEYDSKCSELNKVNSDLATANSEVETMTVELTNKESELTKTKNQLSAYSTTYLPLGVALPSIVAVVLAVFLLKKKKT